MIFDDHRAAHAHGTKQPCGLMFKGIFQKGVYGWLPLNGFSKAFKRSLVISTAGLGVIFTAGLGVIFTAGLGVIFTAGLI